MSSPLLLSVAAVTLAAAARAGERIPWSDPALELYRLDGRDAGRNRVELCVRPKAGVRSGATSVGFPRCRTAWGRSVDCVIVGIDTTRSLSASSDAGPACFAVLVPPGSTLVALPIGDRTVEIPVTEPPVQVEDPWDAEPEPEREPAAPPPAPVSDVDGEVAASLSSRPDAIAVILGVEAYAKAPAASFAAADAKTAARYFEKSLGIPGSRIELRLDGEVTQGQMQRLFGPDGWLARRVTPDTEVFVFFAGHGMAETEKFSPYLLPADADPEYLRQTATSLDAMIESIASLGARKATLFLDACFSGLSREGGALRGDARPLVIERARRAPEGLSIFSAGSGGQIVSALDEQGHGVFSYQLFKGLAGDADLDHDHRILASELKRYLEDAVPRAARTLDREQTPGVVLADPGEVLVQLP